jgi:hypothetical protein
MHQITLINRSTYMDKKPLLLITPIAPSTTLLPRILAVIQHKQYRLRLWRVRIFATTTVLSLIALVPAALGLATAWSTSNASTYLSLVFTDGLTYWRTIGTALVESLPVVSIMLTLVLVGTLLWSIRRMVQFISNDSGAFA